MAFFRIEGTEPRVQVWQFRCKFMLVYKKFVKKVISY